MGLLLRKRAYPRVYSKGAGGVLTERDSMTTSVSDFDVTDARRKLASYREQVPVNSRWKHLKTGGVYWVQALAIQEASGAIMVVYRQCDIGTPWVRPLSEFLDGRFVRVGLQANQKKSA